MGNQSKNAINWGLISHLSGLLMFALPPANAVVPFLLWKLKGQENTAWRSEAKEAFNYNASILLYAFVGGLFCIILIGYPILVVLALTHLVLVIQASVKANRGESVRYPFTLRFIK